MLNFNYDLMVLCIGTFLCKIGIHRWEDIPYDSDFIKVIPYQYHCSRYGCKEVR